MVRAKKNIHDPDLGPIQVRDVPAVSPQEWERGVEETRGILKERRHWKEGKTYTCSSCRRPALVGRSDLTHEEKRGNAVYVFRRLKGARCTHCNVQYLEAGEVIDIEDEIDVGFIADYQAKVSRIGKGTLGTYWPKDVERLLGMRPDQRVFIEILGPDAALIRLRPPQSDA